MSRTAANTDVYSAIADGTRRQILSALGIAPQREQTLTEIAAPFAVTLSAISQHLRVLLAANLVRVRRVGRERRYRLNPAPLEEVATWLGEYERFWDTKIDTLAAYLDEQAANESGEAGESPIASEEEAPSPRQS